MTGGKSQPGPGGERDKNPARDNRRILLRYAGLSSEVLASVGIAVFIGIKADKWLRVSFPIFSWVVPLLVIVVLMIKLVKESPKQNKDGE